MQNYIETLPFWKDLTIEQQELLQAYTIERSFHKGEILDHGNQECTGLEMLVNGQARIFMMSPQGTELTLYRLLEQDICVLSAACMIHSLTFTVSIEFETDTTLLLIPKQILQKISEINCKVKDFITELVADRFSSVMNTMYEVMFSSNEHRLAQALLTQRQLQESTSLSLTHDMLAHELGTAREVVSRLLKQFQKEGLLKLSRGRIILLNEQQLTQR